MTVSRDTARAETAGLAVVADVAKTLTLGMPTPDVLASVARMLQQGCGASGCRVWVREPDGQSYRAITASGEVAPSGMPAGEAEHWIGDRSVLEQGAPGITIRIPLVYEGERLGLLECTLADASGREVVERVTEVVANILAPLLASIELSEDLASEVAHGAREIEAQRQFTAKIIDSLPVGLYVIDRNYVIQAWNRKRETGTQGVSREEALGRDVFEVLHRQPRDLLREEFDEVFSTGSIHVVELESTTSGDSRYYRITKIPMRLAQEITHVIAIGEDITEATEVQAQIAQTEKLAAIGQLVSGVMHEINNPLATISACTEALTHRVNELPASRQDGFTEYLEIVEKEVRRCMRIVDELLDFSRPKPREKKPTQVNQVVEGTLFLLRHHDRFKHLTVIRELSEDLPLVLANGEQLVQVFMALMLNAMDAMDADGQLTVRTRLRSDRPDEVVVEFVDAGAGIPRQNLAKIFEPFYTTKIQGRGTGLGLSICYGIIDEHRGRIEVDSQLDVGSTFRVYLPVAS